MLLVLDGADPPAGAGIALLKLDMATVQEVADGETGGLIASS